MKLPSVEDVIDALQWALDQVGDGPPDPGWHGITGAAISQWRKDREDAEATLKLAQEAGVSNPGQIGPDCAEATIERDYTPPMPCPVCGQDHFPSCLFDPEAGTWGEAPA